MKWIVLFLITPLTTFATINHAHIDNHPISCNQKNVSTGPIFKGLILLSNKKDMNLEGHQDVHGIKIYHIDLPGHIINLKQLLQPYYNCSLNKETISHIKNQIIQFYQNNHHPIVSVQIPEQDISSGVLQVIVSEATLGKIYCTGNKYFKSKKLEKAIKLQPGEPISTNILNQNLYWLNRNPFRQINAIYTPGDTEGTTDIELAIIDRFPLRIYGGIDNTGNDITGNNRLFTGINWGNAFWNDQQLSYQFSSSSDFKRYRGHTLYYEIPLPWKHLLNIYGGYSKVDANFAIPNIQNVMFRTHGFSLQGSLRYQIPLTPSPHLLHEWMCGFDFKRTNNNLDLDEHPIISQNNVNLTQLQLGYNLGYNKKSLSISFEIEGFWSPVEWISDQTDLDYQSLRSFAKNQYLYARTACTFIWRYFNQWSMHNYFRAQLATINLLPSEEYGVGGYNTVRGYKERIVNGDNVFIWNLEIHTPSIQILKYFIQNKQLDDSFEFLAFLDYGLTGVHTTTPGQSKTEYLMSAGPGIRYTIGPYLTLRADWGFQIHNIHLGGPDQRLHFALIIGY